MKILVYPSKEIHGQKLTNICDRLNIEITNDIDSDFDLAIYWNYNSNQMPDQKLIEVSKRIHVINIGLNCVLKRFVDKAWELASGYSITIDPMNPPNCYVRKSQQQWISHTGEEHDGKVFNIPQKPDKEYVYQQLIHNEITKEQVFYRVLRIPIFKRNIPCLYIKDGTHRFKGGGVAKVVRLLDYISKKEVDTILNFCEITKTEYAEIDILRDNNSKLIYAVDINNIAGGAIFNKLSSKESEELQILLAETFKKEFL